MTQAALEPEIREVWSGLKQNRKEFESGATEFKAFAEKTNSFGKELKAAQLILAEREFLHEIAPKAPKHKK